MIIVRMSDGFGNQLYRYTSAYAVARTLGEPLCIDVSDFTTDNYRHYQLDMLNLDYGKTVQFPNRTVVGKALRRIILPLKYEMIYEMGMPEVPMDPRAFQPLGARNRYISGYYQNIKYFRMYEEDIRRQFTPAYDMDGNVSKAIREFANTDSCAIHMRLGDMSYANEEYYRRAMDIMADKIPGVKFIIFSDVVDKARNIVNSTGYDASFISEYGKFSDIDEFFALSACKNQIISVGSYGTWAALLNTNQDKIVIYPDRRDYLVQCEEDWIRIKIGEE